MRMRACATYVSTCCRTLLAHSIVLCREGRRSLATKLEVAHCRKACAEMVTERHCVDSFLIECISSL